MKKDYLVNISSEEKAETEGNIIKIKRKMDPHIAIIVMQSGICLVIVLICLVIKLFFGNFFTEIKAWYDTNINVDTDVTQVINEDSKKGSGGPLELNDEVQTAKITEKFVLPVSGTITSNYGSRTDPFTNKNAQHNGLDIAAPPGTPIKAVIEGRVEVAKYTSGDYGNYIIIDHGGYKTLYGHCDELKVKEGELVKAGDVIATCGNSGRSTGPHLHFEIRIGDKRIDPTPFINLENK